MALVFLLGPTLPVSGQPSMTRSQRDAWEGRLKAEIASSDFLIQSLKRRIADYEATLTNNTFKQLAIDALPKLRRDLAAAEARKRELASQLSSPPAIREPERPVVSSFPSSSSRPSSVYSGERQQRVNQAQAISNGIMDAFNSSQAANRARAEQRLIEHRSAADERMRQLEREIESDASTQRSDDRAAARAAEEKRFAAAARAVEAEQLATAARAVEAQRLAAERIAAQIRRSEAETQTRFQAAKQDFTALLADYRGDTPSVPTSGATNVDSAFTTLFGEVTSRTTDTLFSEMAGQVTEGREPNLREGARSGIGTVVKDTATETARSLYSAVLETLPSSSRTDLRSVELPLSWMTLNIDHIKTTYDDFIEKEIVQPLKAFSPGEK